LFAWEPWFFVAGLGGAALFCLLGALVPAVRASRMDPAAALTGG
jgi:ABC-type lipoprotein release transport system permease subunit